MKDHIFHDDDDRPIPVSEMSDQDIEICLRFGVEPLDDDGTAEQAMERLRLEQFIRQNNLRNQK